MAGILATAMFCPSLAGCTGVRKHPDRWDDAEIAENEAKREQNPKKDAGDKEDGQDGSEGDAKGDTSGGSGSKPVSTIPQGSSGTGTPSAGATVTGDGIWVRTEVRTTLTDESGETSKASYESSVDANGNVKETDIESGDWSGTITYAYGQDGYRTGCSLKGDGGSVDGNPWWVPEFDGGFLGMAVDDDSVDLVNEMGFDGLIAVSFPSDDPSTVISYLHDGQGNLTHIASSAGRSEDYDKQGNLTMASEGDPDDPSYLESIVYAYERDGSGHLRSATLTAYESDGMDITNEVVGRISYETDEHGNVTKAYVTDVDDKFGYKLVVECEYEYVADPSKGARLYSRIDRYGAFF